METEDPNEIKNLTISSNCKADHLDIYDFLFLYLMKTMHMHATIWRDFIQNLTYQNSMARYLLDAAKVKSVGIYIPSIWNDIRMIVQRIAISSIPFDGPIPPLN